MSIERCEPEFIDGGYEGCGACPDCLEREDQELNHEVEAGHITDAQALEIHHDRELRRTLVSLYDDEEDAA